MKRWSAFTNRSGLTLVELSLAVVLSAIVVGSALYSFRKLQQGERSTDNVTQMQRLLVNASFDILQTGMFSGEPTPPPLARTCSVSGVAPARVLDCTVFKNSVTVATRYRIFQQTLLYEEQIGGVYQTIRQYPGITSLVLCEYEDQAGLAGRSCALENTALNATAGKAAGVRTRFIRFGLTAESNRIDSSTKQTVVAQSVQGAFFVRSPFLAGVTILPGKKL